MYKLKIVVGAIALHLAGTVFAQEAGTRAGECTDKRSASEILDKKILDWKRSDLGKALVERDASRDLVLLISGSEGIMSGPSSAQFGKSRELAFAKAFLGTQGMFVMLRKQSIETQTASEFFSAAPSDADLKLDEGEAQGRLMRLGEKIFTLTEATLDNAMREAGVPDEDIKKIEPSKKVSTFKNQIARKSISRAVGEVAGVLPVQNFEATDCGNGAAVAVVSVFSEKNLHFARDVRQGKPIMADKDRASEQTLGAMVDAEVANNEVLDIYGLRKLHDQSGYPSLVSYGQWSFVSDGTTPRSREMKRKAALIQAESNAKAQLANYLGGSVQASDITMTKELVEEFVTVTREGQEAGSADQILEDQLKTLTLKAKVDLTGLRTLASWTTEHPSAPGVTMVGSVLAWSPQFADAINQATGSKKRQAASDPIKGEATDIPGQVQVRSSKAKNNAADF
jgi:hypothetical protein